MTWNGIEKKLISACIKMRKKELENEQSERLKRCYTKKKRGVWQRFCFLKSSGRDPIMKNSSQIKIFNKKVHSICDAS
jgi:hypothetical protein